MTASAHSLRGEIRAIKRRIRRALPRGVPADCVRWYRADAQGMLVDMLGPLRALLRKREFQLLLVYGRAWYRAVMHPYIRTLSTMERAEIERHMQGQYS